MRRRAKTKGDRKRNQGCRCRPLRASRGECLACSFAGNRLRPLPAHDPPVGFDEHLRKSPVIVSLASKELARPVLVMTLFSNTIGR
jgi:hypothetical protein